MRIPKKIDFNIPKIITIDPAATFRDFDLLPAYDAQCKAASNWWESYIKKNIDNGIEIDNGNIMVISKGIENPGCIRVSYFNRLKNGELYAIMHHEYKTEEMEDLFHEHLFEYSCLEF